MNSLPFNHNYNEATNRNNIITHPADDTTSILNNNSNDLLSQIDPDLNYNTLYAQNECKYYTINNFNETFKIKDNLSIFHSNIRSSNAHINDIKCYLATLCTQFSFIGFSETWETETSINNISGYNCNSFIRPHNRRGGGVALYIKENIPYKIRKDLEFYNCNSKKPKKTKTCKSIFETVFIEIEKNVFNSKRNIIIGCLYRAPNSSLQIFNDKLDKLLDTISKEKKYAYLMGDYNINTKVEIIGSTQLTQQFSNIFLTHQYKKLITLATRERNETSNLIDNIYSNDPQNGQSGVFKWDASDHYLIFTMRHIPEKTKKVEFKEIRDYGVKHLSKFKKSLDKKEWFSMLDIIDTNEAFTYFKTFIKNKYDEHFPLQKVKIRYRNRNDWITDEIKAEIVEREKLLKIKKLHPSNENIERYNKFKNANLTKQRKAERYYYKQQFELHANDLRKSWRVIKSIIGKENKMKVVEHIDFIIDDQLVSDSCKVANCFNEYFTSVGRKLASTIMCDVDPLLYIDFNISSIDIPYISPNEILNIIGTLNNSSAGADELLPSIMKQCSTLYIHPLTHLINISISQGVFPDDLKLAKILPIFKSDNKQLIQNYRPISVLPYFSKIFEKIISNYVIDFLETNNTLYHNQFGFRKFHSTSHAIITLVEHVSKALDTGKIVVGIFLDLKKAFDTVDHGILLKKLYAIGIRGNVHEWFKSYLHNRSQYVVYNNATSECHTITHGVPQGSILGPLLFLLYINDFSRASDLLFSIIFADDTSVFLQGTCYDTIIDIMNEELKKIGLWLRANKLTINLKKTHYMVFHRAKIKNTTKIVTIDDTCIETKCNTKFLGIIIDNKLKWNDHVSYVKNKISKSIGIFYRARHFLNKQTLRNLYFTFIYPYLIYCVEIWGNTCAIHLDPLIKLQKKCIRIITFSDKLEHTSPLFEQLDILCFNKLVIHRICIMMFKQSLGILPHSINELFIKNNSLHTHNTRQNDNLHVSMGKGEIMYRTFSYHAIHIWNNISTHTTTDVSYPCFKKIAKKYIQNNDIVYRIR